MFRPRSVLLSGVAKVWMQGGTGSGPGAEPRWVLPSAWGRRTEKPDMRTQSAGDKKHLSSSIEHRIT